MDFQKILVPITGLEETDEETIKMACWLAKKSKSKIFVMYVIAVKRSLPLDVEIESEISRAESVLDRAEQISEKEDCEVETDLLQAREVAPTIVDEAIEKKVDLILMGVKYKARFGQFQLGSIVPYVLKNAPCRVILYSQ